jgi:DNA-binding CsgD family transcriptional regulator
VKPREADSLLSEASEELIHLLATGLNDKAIAHEAGISAATMTRRINDLMKSFDTRTRFQLGWRAALKAFPERLAAETKGKHAERIRQRASSSSSSIGLTYIPREGNTSAVSIAAVLDDADTQVDSSPIEPVDDSTTESPVTAGL